MNVCYRSVGNRCAVHLESLKLPISNEEALGGLERMGFKQLKVDMNALARECIQKSKYRRGARPVEAPEIVDCSSFSKWIYGQRGIWLPRRSIQQRECGETVQIDQMSEGDLVFVKGVFDWYYDDPEDGVGHVGIISGNETVIHAADADSNVIESSFERFISKLKFRGIRRCIPLNAEVITLEIPSTRDVETSDDLRWLILQTLTR